MSEKYDLQTAEDLQALKAIANRYDLVLKFLNRATVGSFNQKIINDMLEVLQTYQHYMLLIMQKVQNGDCYLNFPHQKERSSVL